MDGNQVIRPRTESWVGVVKEPTARWFPTRDPKEHRSTADDRHAVLVWRRLTLLLPLRWPLLLLLLLPLLPQKVLPSVPPSVPPSVVLKYGCPECDRSVSLAPVSGI